jgi:hypothetical protein
MKRIMISCVALAAFAAPAFAGAGGVTVPDPNVPNNGTFGTDRAVYAPLGSDPTFAGAIVTRGGSNSTDNLLWLNNHNGVTTGNALQSNPNPVDCTGLGGSIPGC